MPRDTPSVSSATPDQEEDPFRNGVVVQAAHVSERAQRRVRDWVGSSRWHFERRNGYVRPPRSLPCGRECAIAALGECGDRKCGNYRLGEKTADVRPSFLDFCIEHIRSAFSPAILKAGIVYCSLGSGQLLFDWELLERLTLEEGARLRAVYLIDKDYGGPKRRDSAVRAQQLLAGWYADQGDDEGPCEFRSFLSAADFQEWAQHHGEAAHVLLDCDAVGARKKMDVALFRSASMRLGGVCLVLSNPAKRTAIMKHRAAGADQDMGLKVLEQEVYRRSEWRHLASVSRSRTRSRQRRRRSRSRRRRSGREDCRCCDGPPQGEPRRVRSRSREAEPLRRGHSRQCAGQPYASNRADSRDTR